MSRPLLVKGLRDLRTQTLLWSLGLGAMLAFTILFYPATVELFEAIELPDAFMAFEAFFGPIADMATYEGFLNGQFFSFGALILAVFAIMAGGGALAGEESDGTLDLVLSQPVSRSRLLLAKAAAVIVALGIVCLVILVVIVVFGLLVGAELSPGRFLNAVILLWLYEVAVAMLAMTASLLLPARKGAGIVIALALVASYIIQSLGEIVEELAALRPVLPTVYYQADAAMVGQVDWGYTVGVAAAIVTGLALALWLFHIRDIGAQAPGKPVFRLGRNAG